MKITVSSVNEYEFIPDIHGNLKEPKDKQFKIIVKKVNRAFSSGKWSKVTADGEVKVNMAEKIKSQIVRIENPPKLEIKDVDKNGVAFTKEVEMTKSHLMNVEFVELHDLQTELFLFINKLELEGSIETKK